MARSHLSASDLARRCYRTYYKNWSEHSHTHESYNGYTGSGDDISISAEPCHPWACLLPYLSIQDFVDYEVWNGLRLGRLEPLNASINEIPIQGNTYSVRILDKKQTILQNNEIICTSNHPTILRNAVFDIKNVSFSQKALQPIELNIRINPGTYEITIGEEKYSEAVNNSCLITLNLKELKNEIKVQ